MGKWGGGNIALSDGQSHYFSASELGYHDADGDSLDHITILSLPTQGSLALYSYYPVSSGQSIDSYALDSGYLVYTPDSNAPASYTTTFDFSVNDGQDNSLPASFTLNVGVTSNTPPTVAGSVHSLPSTSSKTITTADLGYADADGDHLRSITITALPTTGTLLNYGYPVSVGSTIDAYHFSYGTIVYQPSTTATASYADSFSFTASDGTVSSSPATLGFNVSVTPNAAPLVTGSVVAVAYSSSKTLTLGNLGYSDPEGDLLQSITITALPTTGTLTLYGYPITVGTNITPQYIGYGYLAYAPDANNHSAHTTGFSFTASDGHHSSSPGTVTLNVAGNTNTAPETSSLALAVPETGTFTLTAGNFAFSDIDGDDLDHITILSLPSQGTLSLGGYPITNGQSIDLYTLDSNYLVYTPNSIAPASYSASFAFTVSDGQVSSPPASLTLNVTIAPNTPPTVTGAVYSLPSTGSKTISTADLGYSDADGDALELITITVLPTSGTLLRSGYPVAVGATINAYEYSYGSIVYQPDTTATTSYVDTFSFTASDGESPSAPAAFVFNVSVASNAAPSVTGSVVTVPTGSSKTLTLSNLGYADPEGDSLQSITITVLPTTGTLTLYGTGVAVGTNITAQYIDNGYLAYAPDTTNQSAHVAAFSFTASDGHHSSSPATITFNVAGNSNTAPVTSNHSLAVPEIGSLTLSAENFPYSNVDGDAFSHVTILSLPSTASLTINGIPVGIGDTLDAETLSIGAVELQFESSTGGSPVASFSFSVSDGISNSASATITATRTVTNENRRPTTSTVDRSSEIDTTQWLASADFPFSDPDGDLLHHVNILNIPLHASLVDRAGVTVTTATPITAAMLASGDIGIVLTDTAIDDSFNIVFTVSDGNLDSFPSVVTLTFVATLPTDELETVDRINLKSTVGPVITLDNGFVTGPLFVPGAERIADWRDGIDDAGVLVSLPDNAWTYTETYDAGPTDDFDESLVYVFIAAGVGSTLTSYSVTVTGTTNTNTPAPGSDIVDLPADAPLPSTEPNSLTYTLTVAVAADGTVDNSTTLGRYHVSSYDATIDEPYSSSSETVASNSGTGGGSSGSGGSAGGTGSEPSTTTYTDAGSYTLIIASSTTLTFDSTGTTVDSGDSVFYTYTGGGSYGTAPFTGTSTESGTVIASSTVSGRVLLDGTPASLTFVDHWYDESTFGYTGGGTETKDGVTTTIIDNGSDTFIDQGTVTIVLDGEDVDISGNSSITASGNYFYDFTWSKPLVIDDATSHITGTTGGSVTQSDHYADFIEFQIGLIPPATPESTEPPVAPPVEPPAEPTYGWLLIGGTFDDFSESIVKSHYDGSGTYTTTGGSGPAPGGGAGVALNTPITGTISLGGKTKSSITYIASGSFDAVSVTLDIGSLNFHESADSFVDIIASGPINSGGLTGSITIADHFKTDTLRDITFDLTDENLAATGFGHDYVMSDTKFDQLATGTLTSGDLSGSQWANLHDHAFTEIDAHYIWSNGDAQTEADWITTTATFTIINDSFSDIGYDISGIVTRDDMTGIATDYAKDTDSNFLKIVITSGTVVEPSFEFISVMEVAHKVRTTEALTGTVIGTLEPSGAVLLLAKHRDTSNGSHMSLKISTTLDGNGDFVTTGYYSIGADNASDTGRVGSGPYTRVDGTRVDGDTTFVGTASLFESTVVGSGFSLLFSLDENGKWQLGASLPNADFDTVHSYSNAVIRFDTSYHSITGDIDGTSGPAHWTGTATESGQANFSVDVQILGTPSVAPPPVIVADEGGGEGNGTGNGGGNEDGEGGNNGGNSDSKSTENNDFGGLPELVWTYTGTLDIGSAAGGSSGRDASAIYNSGTLTGSLTEKNLVSSEISTHASSQQESSTRRQTT